MSRASTHADPLSRAFDRLDAFVAVQTAGGAELTVDAVNLLQEAVGIDEERRAILAERAPLLGAGEHAGAVLLGVLVGLFAADEHDGRGLGVAGPQGG